MCCTTAYKSATCRHRWLTITTRCSPYAGFTNTPIHQFQFDSTSLFGGPHYQKASAGSCPTCDLKGQYDGNTTRIVLSRGGVAAGHIPLTTIRTGTNISNGGGVVPQGLFTHPALGITITNGQVLTPYQQQFAASKQAAAIASMQYYPEGNYGRRPRDTPLCSVM